jgi:hypothetical protein
MKLSAMTLAALLGASSEMWATGTPAPATHFVITVRPAHHGGEVPNELRAADLTLTQGNVSTPVLRVQRLIGDLGDMQLFVLVDDSTRASSLGLQLPALKTFLQSLPPTTQVAIGYLHNGTSALAQGFTADHRKAADALRLPVAIPGVNGSPYFGLSDLVKHWPSEEPTHRRAVLMMTDGVDRYYGTQIEEDPYVDSAISDALKNGVAVYSIYLRGAGSYGRSDWATDFAQSRLSQVSQETGGHTYFEDFTDPVTIAPFLDDFRDRLENQYEITFVGPSEHGLQRVKLRTAAPGLRIEYPSRTLIP